MRERFADLLPICVPRRKLTSALRELRDNRETRARSAPVQLSPRPGPPVQASQSRRKRNALVVARACSFNGEDSQDCAKLKWKRPNEANVDFSNERCRAAKGAVAFSAAAFRALWRS